MYIDTEILEQLEKLERELHKPLTRGNIERLCELLHADFREFGRNGRFYTRSDILEELVGEDGSLRIWSGDYALQHATANSALIIYKSAHIEQNGALSSFSLRSSLWVRETEKWSIIFHQGTPATPF